VVRRPNDFTSLAAAQTWIAARFGEWAKSLTDGERLALHDYKGTGYREINEWARGGDRFDADEELRATVARLDRALARYRLLEAVWVYRGIAEETYQLLTNAVVGATVADAGYWSTTLVRETAEKFLTDSSDEDDEPVLLRILLPGGMHAISAGAPDLVREMSEAEILLPRGSRFTVLETHLADDFTPHHTIDLEAHPS
jgi:hypothetical protein